MLVTHVITRLIVGGAQENTVATVLGLACRGPIRSDLITGPTRPGAGSSEAEGTLDSAFRDQPELLEVCSSLIRPVRPAADIRALRELRQMIRRRKPVIVHTHSGKAGILGRWAAHLERVPIVIHTIHGPSFGPWQGRAANAINWAAERFVAPMTTYFIAVAQAMIDQYRQASIPGEYTKIFSGFPLEPFLQSKNDPALRAAYGIGPDDIVVGKIARMFELKGHDDLIDIAPDLIGRCPHAKFLLVGGGPWEERLKARAAQAGLDNHFVFTGLLPPEKIPPLTGIIDILAHLSLREGLPRAISQTLAAGKPVVAYDCDGAREVCLPGKTGFLAGAGDKAALLQHLQILIENRDLREKLGRAGREMIQANFSVEGMVEAIYQLYLRLLREKGLLEGSL